MESELFSVGLAHKVCLAAEEQGYTPELLNALAENKNLFGQMLQIQRGLAEIKTIENIIDCDTDPFIPEGWEVIEHKKGGQFKWNSTRVELYLDKEQKNGKNIEGNKLRKKLEDKSVLNANVLDFLLAHPHLIPEEWKNKYVFFWGTIYRDADGGLCVRCLFWHGDRWYWYYHWLDHDWHGNGPAAVRASSQNSET